MKHAMSGAARLIIIHVVTTGTATLAPAGPIYTLKDLGIVGYA
jgi:hypothetical protein